MKVCVYGTNDDERKHLPRYSEELGVELTVCDDHPTPENLELARGCEGVSILGGCYVGPEMLDTWYDLGVRYLSTRTIGYDHIDVEYAGKIGMRVAHASYAPEGVADFTVMMMLMCLRNYKQSLWRGQVNDFSLPGLMGREMRDLTVGVMGTGRIGRTVMRELSGFGCTMLAWDAHPTPVAEAKATYVDLDELLERSDIITLHLPLLPSTFHIIGRDEVARMKDGVILVNCARGELCDTDALIEGIESEKIGALGLDVIEGEEQVIRSDRRVDIIPDRRLFYLRQFRNVVMTPHMAFYTAEAVESMVADGLRTLVEMASGKPCELEIRA